MSQELLRTIRRGLAAQSRERRLQYPWKYDPSWDIPVHSCVRARDKMRLAELNPRLLRSDVHGGNFLVFDCPVCCCQDTHKIRVPLAPAVDARWQSWQHTGEFPDSLTLSPSIDAGCWHGHIQEGKIVG